MTRFDSCWSALTCRELSWIALTRG